MLQNRSGFPASLLLLGTISLLLFLGYELWETQQRNQVLTQRLLKLQEKREGGSKSQEIYLSKAVKNTLVKQAGLTKYQIARHWPERFVLTWKKPSP